MLKMALDYVLEFLEFSDIVKSSHVSHRFNLAYVKYITLRSNKWIISQVDHYLSCQKIIAAERLLRYYICLNDISGNDPKMRNKFAQDKSRIIRNYSEEDTILSKYISILSTYIWDNQWYNPKYRNHRSEIYKYMRRRVYNNINNYSIYIPIDMYSCKNSTIESPYKKIYPDSLSGKIILSDDCKYIIASIFAYICLRDKQTKLAQDIATTIEKKCKIYNVIFCLVKWHLTSAMRYLKPFNYSKFAFGMYIYGCERHVRNINDHDRFIKILQKCIELDSSFICAINTLLHNKTPICTDLVYSGIITNVGHIPSHITNLKYLINCVIQDRGFYRNMIDILRKIEKYMMNNVSLFPSLINHRYDIKNEIPDLIRLDFHIIFMNIHYMLYDQNLIVQNLILFYRINSFYKVSKLILLYIQKNLNPINEYKTYILEQLTTFNH